MNHDAKQERPVGGFASGELLDGKYRVDRLLGQGGMGAVYRATHLGTKRVVAVKIIHPHFSSNEEFIERFRREAEAAGRLRHPNVVDVTDFGFARTGSGPVAYLVMEYLDGCTLAEVLAEEQHLQPAWVVDILEQVCSAVGEAHSLGIIHPDLKPDNIWLEPNRRGGYTVKVLDFGLVKLGDAEFSEGKEPASESPWVEAADATAAKPSTLIRAPTTEETDTLIQPADPAPPRNPAASQPFIQGRPASGDNGRTARGPLMTEARSLLEAAGAAELTRAGFIVGTPLYMSPEQWRGEHLDWRSDIYSLGVIAYRMLGGETPFTGSVNELIKLHETAEPQPLREKNSKVPKRMARLIMATLSREPSERPESAVGFASALRASLEGSGTLLQQALSLYSERFPTFLKISLLAYAPLIALIGFLNLDDLFHLIPWEHLALNSILIVALALLLSLIVTNLLAYFTVSALTAPVVLQLMIAPLRQVRVRTALTVLRRHWRTLLATSAVVLAMILAGIALFIVPGAVAAVCCALYAPVVVMEGKGV